MNNAVLLTVLLIVLVVLVVLIFLMIGMQRQIAVSRSAMEKQLQATSNQALENRIAQNESSKQMFEEISRNLSSMHSAMGSEKSLLYGLQNSMREINTVMSNAKQRGNWGEYQMETLIRVYAGETPSLYEKQYRLANGRIADGAFHLPGTDQVLCIDSKFPMENYINMIEEPEDEAYFSRELRKNVKKHIDDVASKYITDQTADMALLFIPSEAIYQYILAEQPQLFESALSKHVLMSGPTTLSGIVFTLVSGTQDFYRSSHADQIEKQLLLIRQKMQDLEDRVNKAAKNASLLDSQLAGISTVSKQISREISQVVSGEEDQPE